MGVLRPGLAFAAITLVAWLWPRIGGVVLILTGIALAAWYLMHFGQMPVGTKLFVLTTFALPPLASGLIQLWPAPRKSGIQL